MKSFMVIKLRHLILISILIVFTNPIHAENSISIYTNNMQYVLGDTKQAFITNKITTIAQAENLILGFKAMKVNGIRMPIFATGLCPNKTMYDYFFQRATAEGFPIFANPAQSSGGHRIACGMLNGDVCYVKDDTEKTNVLINTIIAFANEYPCKWINPFNEDGQPDVAFSTNQINTIYSTLYNNINGAQLIGSCAWGIPASIAVFKGTNIKNYITVSSTHNLGFNHSSWPTFISLSKAANLPVWDSEVTNYDAKGNGTRLAAALQYGVDGLVMYDTWSNISLTKGTVNAGGQVLMSLYLKSTTDINQVENSSYLTISPNPSSDFIQINSSEKLLQIEVLDLDAKVLKTINSENSKIDISFLKPGIYLVKCKTQEDSLIKRFIKK